MGLRPPGGWRVPSLPVPPPPRLPPPPTRPCAPRCFRDRWRSPRARRGVTARYVSLRAGLSAAARPRPSVCERLACAPGDPRHALHPRLPPALSSYWAREQGTLSRPWLFLFCSLRVWAVGQCKCGWGECRGLVSRRAHGRFWGCCRRPSPHLPLMPAGGEAERREPAEGRGRPCVRAVGAVGRAARASSAGHGRAAPRARERGLAWGRPPRAPVSCPRGEAGVHLTEGHLCKSTRLDRRTLGAAGRCGRGEPWGRPWETGRERAWGGGVRG